MQSVREPKHRQSESLYADWQRASVRLTCDVALIILCDYPQNDLLLQIIQQKDDIEGRSPEILVAKNVLHKLSRDSGDISSKDVRAMLLNHLFTFNATEILELRT